MKNSLKILYVIVHRDSVTADLENAREFSERNEKLEKLISVSEELDRIIDEENFIEVTGSP